MENKEFDKLDSLNQIFYMQNAFNQKLRKDRGLEYSSTEWIQKEALALMVELAEVMDEAKYKWWKDQGAVEPDKLKEELVDVFHFFLSMCLDAGMDADELHALYMKKNRVNFERQMGLWGENYKANSTDAKE